MPRRTAACRRVSHRVIYSPGAPEMPWHAMGSKNSAYAGPSGARRLVHRPDSVAIAAGGLRAKGRLSFKTGVFGAIEPPKAANRGLWDKNKNSKP